MFNILSCLTNGLKLLLLACAVLSLLACGGGGGGDSADTAPINATQSAPDGFNPEQPASIVEAPVVVVAQPQSTTILSGESAQFSVAANGGGSLSFQWRKNGTAISGATSSSLIVASADLSDAASYDVIVSNSVSTVTSLAALLSVVSEVEQAPAVVQQPAVQEPAVQEPVNQEPAIQEPVVQEPITQEPITQEPITQEPITQEPVTQEPVTQEPVTQEPVTQEPVVQEPEIIAEQPVVPAIVELTWDIPLQREDGSDLALYEINGYVINYGTSPDNLDGVIEIVGGGQTSVLIDELPANTYYFAIATIDSDGVQGSYSEVITQTIL